MRDYHAASLQMLDKALSVEGKIDLCDGQDTELVDRDCVNELEQPDRTHLKLLDVLQGWITERCKDESISFDIRSFDYASMNRLQSAMLQDGVQALGPDTPISMALLLFVRISSMAGVPLLPEVAEGLTWHELPSDYLETLSPSQRQLLSSSVYMWRSLQHVVPSEQKDAVTQLIVMAFIDSI